MRKIKYFTASWCGPCKFFKPTLKELVNDGVDVEFLDIDSHSEEVAANKITTVPTLIFQKDNEDYARVSGIVSKEYIKSVLDQPL